MVKYVSAYLVQHIYMKNEIQKGYVIVSGRVLLTGKHVSSKKRPGLRV